MITKDVILSIAALARLRLPAADLDRYTRHAARILEYVAQLNAVDTRGVEPTAHAVETTGFTRADCVQPFAATAEILANAPARDGDFYQVPKVL